MKERLKKVGTASLTFARTPLGFFCLSLALCAATQASMTTEVAETTIKSVGRLFTGSGFKVGLGVSTVIGMVVAAAKHSVGMAAMVMGIGVAASVWIAKITEGMGG